MKIRWFAILCLWYTLFASRVEFASVERKVTDTRANINRVSQCDDHPQQSKLTVIVWLSQIVEFVMTLPSAAPARRVGVVASGTPRESRRAEAGGFQS
jgi:hypothetical protein